MGEIGTAQIIHSKSNVGDVVDVANGDLDEAKRSNRREHTPPTVEDRLPGNAIMARVASHRSP